ncbi:unnamed protein product [Amoebophrya sp. A25]|nr:unnamed protein product [Amoebophrya sp. A25]|eukprot:GSA25T00003645001.1
MPSSPRSVGSTLRSEEFPQKQVLEPASSRSPSTVDRIKTAVVGNTAVVTSSSTSSSSSSSSSTLPETSEKMAEEQALFEHVSNFLAHPSTTTKMQSFGVSEDILKKEEYGGSRTSDTVNAAVFPFADMASTSSSSDSDADSSDSDDSDTPRRAEDAQTAYVRKVLHGIRDSNDNEAIGLSVVAKLFAKYHGDSGNLAKICAKYPDAVGLYLQYLFGQRLGAGGGEASSSSSSPSLGAGGAVVSRNEKTSATAKPTERGTESSAATAGEEERNNLPNKSANKASPTSASSAASEEASSASSKVAVEDFFDVPRLGEAEKAVAERIRAGLQQAKINGADASTTEASTTSASGSTSTSTMSCSGGASRVVLNHSTGKQGNYINNNSFHDPSSRRRSIPASANHEGDDNNGPEPMQVDDAAAATTSSKRIKISSGTVEAPVPPARDDYDNASLLRRLQREQV